MISERASRNIVRAIITIIVLMILPPWKEMWVYLQSVDFRFDHVFSWAYEPIRNFDKYQEPLDLLVKEIDSFVESEPHFFDEFTGECSVYDDGIIFYRKGLSYPDSRVFYKFTVENSGIIQEYTEVFPYEFHLGDKLVNEQYPDYIFFCSDTEYSWRFLVYTRGEHPNQLIDEYREKYDFVRVTEVAPGWYDFCPD